MRTSILLTTIALSLSPLAACVADDASGEADGTYASAGKADDGVGDGVTLRELTYDTGNFINTINCFQGELWDFELRFFYQNDELYPQASLDPDPEDPQSFDLIQSTYPIEDGASFFEILPDHFSSLKSHLVFSIEDGVLVAGGTAFGVESSWSCELWGLGSNSSSPRVRLL